MCLAKYSTAEDQKHGSTWFCDHCREMMSDDCEPGNNTVYCDGCPVIWHEACLRGNYPAGEWLVHFMLGCMLMRAPLVHVYLTHVCVLFVTLQRA